MNRIVFIDRDGVINVDPIGDYIKSWDQFQFEPGAIEALKAIYGAGIEIIIISNQAGIGDGVYPESELWNIHRNMLKALESHGIKIKAAHYCLHGKNAGCKCRKPEIGLFQKAVDGLIYDPLKTYFIGDKATDMEAGKRFGLKTIFVRTGHGRFDEQKLKPPFLPDFKVNRLSDAVSILTQ